jgi:hypothetical protein
MGTKFRRFYWLAPGTLNTLKVRALSGASASEFSEIEILTSGFEGMTWDAWKKVKARPVFWNRTIVVTWEPIAEPLRMDFYRLFRKEDTTSDGSDPPLQADIDDNSTDNQYWVEDTGRKTRRVDHILGQEPDILKLNYYWYWVWAFDKAGNPSAHWLGGGGPETTPDSARFGPPNKPAIEEVDFEHQQVIKWLADATVKWKVSGHAEGYWLQRKMNASALWGPLVWVDHDETLPLQEGTMGNYITGVEYDWRVKAVNVPVALVSDWSDTYTKKIPFDSVRPDEVEGVNARRLYIGGLQKGERIKVRWLRPEAALMTQQIEQYEIFRKIGSDADATAYATQINSGGVSAYEADSQNFGMVAWLGTQFIDDDVEPLEQGGETSWGFTWTAEGATDLERRTATTTGGTKVGTIGGTGALTNAEAHDGTWSLQPGTTGYIEFENAIEQSISGDEGYLEFWWKGDYTSPGTNGLFSFQASGPNRMWAQQSVAGGIQVYRFGSGRSHLAQIPFADVSTADPSTNWVKVEIRWSVINDKLEARIASGTWYSQPAGLPLLPYIGNTDIALSYGLMSSTGWMDDFKISLTYELEAGDEYYHYWVRSRDVSGLRSLVSMNSGLSYDKVSFEPPPAPTNLDIISNAIDRWWFTRFTMLITWDAEPEAVYYRVAMRIKGPGRANFGPWLKSAFLDEARITEIDDDDPLGVPKHTVPFTVSKETEVEYKVSAGNKAGETWSTVKSEVIITDDLPPTQITTLDGEAYGFNLLGLKLWFNVWLTWDDLPWYEGINNYEIYWYNAGSWESRGSIKPTLIARKVRFWIPMLPGLGGSHKFQVKATDGDENSTLSNIVEVPWQAFWDWRDRGP